MTNINCTANCIYQKDGKCSYHIVSMSSISQDAECAYFIPCSLENNSSVMKNKRQLKY